MKYVGTDKMSDLICENHKLLLVMSRFGLSLGFGDKTVEQVCRQQGVHTGTFLAVANFMDDKLCMPDAGYCETISLDALTDYLRQSHSYFLDFSFPAIRRKLIDAIDCSRNEVTFLILKFFDEYVNEVRDHMEYEDQVVFEYVDRLLKGEKIPDYNIRIFAARHNLIDPKLTELKNIIIKYYPLGTNSNLLNSVLFDIYSNEKDLYFHSRVEDYMFVPFIMKLEKKIQENAQR